MTSEVVISNESDAAPHGVDLRLRRFRRLLVGALVVLAVLLLVTFFLLLGAFEPPGRVASTKEAGGVTWVRSIYGWGNTISEQLSSPQSVAVGPNGLIWVTDAGMGRVISFKPDGSFNSILDTGERGTEGALSFPCSVAVDEEGLVYIGDKTASQVVVMSADKTVIRRIQVPRPQAVAVRGDRLVVGSDPGFVIMSKAGEVKKVLGTMGSGDDQFNGVTGIAIAEDGTIYVVDQYNNRISAYDTNGNRLWIRIMGAAGNQTTPQASMEATAAVNSLQLPSGIAIDGSGHLVIVDAFGFNLVVLDPKDGRPIASFGEAGATDGTFVYPSDVAYDPARDWFVVADTSMDRVQVIRIPNTGGSIIANVNRSLAGPLRACLVPLALLLVVIIAAFVYDRVRRRREQSERHRERAQRVAEAAETDIETDAE